MFSVEFTTLESITITHIQLSSNCSGITEENFHLEMERLAGTPIVEKKHLPEITQVA
jgi:hypothetical protein